MPVCGQPGGQREGLPPQGRPPAGLCAERGGSPEATPGDALGRERREPGTHGAQGDPIWVLDGVAQVQRVSPAPVNGGRAAADEPGVGNLPRQQRPSPAARREDAPPDGCSPYLNKAQATYAGGMSELDAALRRLHHPDKELELGEVTILAEGAGETPARPSPPNLVYNGRRPTHRHAVMFDAFLQVPLWCPANPPATHAPRSWAQSHLSPSPLQDQGPPAQRACPLARVPFINHEPRAFRVTYRGLSRPN